jgi:hypothetical protein
MAETLPCSMCGSNAIEAPEGATPQTRFTCRFCSARVARRRNVAECRVEAKRHQLRLDQAELRRKIAAARMAELFDVAKTWSELSGQALAVQHPA